MRKPLFRAEAMQIQRNHWLGSISLTQPPALVWLAMLAVFAALSVLGLLTFGEYTQRVHASGELVRDPGAAQWRVDLWVAGSDIGIIVPGAHVLLRYQAYPHQKFGLHQGHVLKVVDATDAVIVSDRHRVVVAVDRDSLRDDAKSIPLRHGLRVDADLLGERRKLYQWLFEPVLVRSATDQ